MKEPPDNGVRGERNHHYKRGGGQHIKWTFQNVTALKPFSRHRADAIGIERSHYIEPLKEPFRAILIYHYKCD